MIVATLQVIAAFNLVCAGTERTGPLGLALPESGGTPFAITYRIDLDRQLWCSDPCDTTEPVASVLDGQIVLREHYNPHGSSVITFTPATRRFTGFPVRVA